MALRHRPLNDGACCLDSGPAELGVAKERDEPIEPRQHERCGPRQSPQPLDSGRFGNGGVLACGGERCINLSHHGRISLLRLGSWLIRLLFLGGRLCTLLVSCLGGDCRPLRVPYRLGLRLLNVSDGFDVGRVLLEPLQSGLEFLLLCTVGLVLGGLSRIVDLHLVLEDEFSLLFQRTELNRGTISWLRCGRRRSSSGRGRGSLRRRGGRLGCSGLCSRFRHPYGVRGV
mmetsp:Transcript_45482/g.141318  ORF Transcript_45482/g.141318 Transcript_45482/m.141318 type:complete len:229 (-) Transcript_45482:39-725(-)